MAKPHVYCFVDENGQDTLGKFFLVAAILVEHNVLQDRESALLGLELKTRKSKSKWTKTAFSIKQQFLQEVATRQALRASV